MKCRFPQYDHEEIEADIHTGDWVNVQQIFPALEHHCPVFRVERVYILRDTEIYKEIWLEQ